MQEFKTIVILLFPRPHPISVGHGNIGKVIDYLHLTKQKWAGFKLDIFSFSIQVPSFSNHMPSP